MPSLEVATIPEAADFMRISVRKVYLLLDDDQLEAIRIGRSRRILWQSIYDLIESGRSRCHA